MKLNEVLDADQHMKNLDVLNTDKTKSAKTSIKLLRKKANKRNRKTPDTNQHSIYANHDALAGTPDTASGSRWQASYSSVNESFTTFLTKTLDLSEAK